MSFNECKNVLSKFNIGSNYDDLFLQFVYSKIARNTKNRFVDKTDDSVDIILSNHPCIKVIPIFKKMDKNNLSLNKEIKKAISVIGDGEFTFVYFVYPRNDNFDKHIEVRVPQLEEACSDYMVKIIPYSLNDLINTKKRKCNGNSNILCK
jgi:hypothetical protein